MCASFLLSFFLLHALLNSEIHSKSIEETRRVLQFDKMQISTEPKRYDCVEGGRKIAAVSLKGITVLSSITSPNADRQTDRQTDRHLVNGLTG